METYRFTIWEIHILFIKQLDFKLNKFGCLFSSFFGIQYRKICL